MATALLRCTECDAVRDPSNLPPNWYHHPRRDDRQRIWPDRCPLCGQVLRKSEPQLTIVESMAEAEEAAAKEAPVPNPRMDTANLEALWSYATTHRERAQIEAQMWEIAKPNLPKAIRKGGIARWLNGRLGEASDTISDRYMLHRYGTDVGDLWGRIDGSERMLVRRAAQLLSQAKLRATSELTTLREALANELADYDKGTLIITDAGTFRRRRETHQRAAPMGKRRNASRRKGVDVTASRNLWMAVRASIKRVVDHELGEIGNAHTREVLFGQVEVELQGVISYLQARITRARSTAHLDGAPPVVENPVEQRKLLKRACQTLSVDPPHGGVEVDFVLYKRAKTNYRRLVREYHPDHGGEADRYDAVVKAMNFIEERYQATSSGSATGNENNKNNKDS